MINKKNRNELWLLRVTRITEVDNEEPHLRINILLSFSHMKTGLGVRSFQFTNKGLHKRRWLETWVSPFIRFEKPASRMKFSRQLAHVCSGFQQEIPLKVTSTHCLSDIKDDNNKDPCLRKTKIRYEIHRRRQKLGRTSTACTCGKEKIVNPRYNFPKR